MSRQTPLTVERATIDVLTASNVSKGSVLLRRVAPDSPFAARNAWIYKATPNTVAGAERLVLWVSVASTANAKRGAVL